MFTILTVIRTEKVALTLDGKFDRILGPGTHWIWTGGKNAETTTVNLATTVVEAVPLADVWPKDLAGAELVRVAAGERLIVFVNGGLFRVLGVGTWRIWTEAGAFEHRLVEVDAEPKALPDADGLQGHLGTGRWTDHQAGDGVAFVLNRDGEPFKVWTEGRFRIWSNTRWTAEPVDLSLQVLELAVQDVLTSDQVAIRVKPVVTWRVEDALVFARNDEATDLLWTAVQLALREVVAARTLEQLLAEKRALAGELTDRTVELLPGVGIAVETASVKDVVLPGEVKDILKKVTVARKEAEAQAIRRREEVAHTRQLLNTAKLLDQNPTLKRLTELDKLAEIAGSVGEVKLVLGGEELQKLARLE
ncbi:MAG: slipin family protein [Proteobacteria bacterium]|nr:slipin family protein [Pseudomonadota bacterium]